MLWLLSRAYPLWTHSLLGYLGQWIDGPPPSHLRASSIAQYYPAVHTKLQYYITDPMGDAA